MQRINLYVLVMVLLVLPANLAFAGSYAGTFEYHSATPESTFNGVVNGTYTGTNGSYAGVFGQATNNYARGVYGYTAAFGGIGVFGYSGGTNGKAVNGYAYYGTGVHGASSQGTGVYGVANLGRDGIYGVSQGAANGRGVVGKAYGDQGIGVFGHATSTNYGVLTTGVYGVTSGGKGVGVRGIALSGASINFGGYFESKSQIGYGVLGNATATSGANYGVLGRTASPSGYGVYSDGNMRVLGNFTATGSKSAVVKVGQHDHVKLYAEESTENWFSDYGAGELKSGQADIEIDPLFKKTVNTENEYHVFLTPYGKCNGLYVTNRTPDRFEVRELNDGESSIAFSYRIVVKRKGYESERMATASPPKDTVLSEVFDSTYQEINSAIAKN